MAKQARRSASAQTQRVTKASVPLGVETHAKLAALAALRGVPMSAIMAEAIEDAVRSMVVFDRAARVATKADSPASVDSIGDEAA